VVLELDFDQSVARRNVTGGTAGTSVEAQITEAWALLRGS